MELVNTYVPLAPLAEGLHMENDEVHIADGGEQGVFFCPVRPSDEEHLPRLARTGG